MSLEHRLSASAALLRRVCPVSVTGTVIALQGLLAEVGGLTGLLAIGDRLHLRARDGRIIPAEVTGFRHDLAQVMAFAPLEGLGPGSKAEILTQYHALLDVASGWLGRSRSTRWGGAARRQGSIARRHDATTDESCSARGDAAGTCRTTHRSGRTRAQLLRHLPGRPAAWIVRRLRNRQIEPVVDADPRHRLRRGRAGSRG